MVAGGSSGRAAGMYDPPADDDTAAAVAGVPPSAPRPPGVVAMLLVGDGGPRITWCRMLSATTPLMAPLCWTELSRLITGLPTTLLPP